MKSKVLMAVEAPGEEEEEEDELEAKAEEELDSSGGAKALGCVGDRSGDRREKVMEDTPSVRSSGGSAGGSTPCVGGGSEVGAARAGAVSAAGTA